MSLDDRCMARREGHGGRMLAVLWLWRAAPLQEQEQPEHRHDDESRDEGLKLALVRDVGKRPNGHDDHGDREKKQQTNYQARQHKIKHCRPPVVWATGSRRTA